ncbi:hypothetical protein, partial [Pseudomonas aeruginosa]|uniref:hypothetical protein n=1 Tax=Pseudomonas aeruginosa TaxID=287 RepID=UPI00196936C4
MSVIGETWAISQIACLPDRRRSVANIVGPQRTRPAIPLREAGLGMARNQMGRLPYLLSGFF